MRSYVAYDAATEGDACDSMVVETSSLVAVGFVSPSSSRFGITGSVRASAVVDGAVLCGAAASVCSLALAVEWPEVAPPLPPPRARALPLPLAFGGIGGGVS